MSAGRIPTTANSPLTAKGDLFSFSTAPARLAVGSNGDTIVANSSTSTGLSYQGNYAAGKNKIINGDFSVNQRAFTSNTTNAAFNFDRFYQINADGSFTVTPQTFTPGAAPEAGYEGKSFLRGIVASQSLSSAQASFRQNIESVRTFAGQSVTMSFFAQAGSGAPKIGANLVQFFGSGGSPSAVVVLTGQSQTISTSFARYSFTFSVGSISGKTIGTNGDDYLRLEIWCSAGSDFAARSGSVGIQNNTFNIWGVQVEAGSVATAFQTATGTIQQELAACQRYYWFVAGGAVDLALSNFAYFNATDARGVIQFPQTMRVAPTQISASGTNYFNFEVNGGQDGLNFLGAVRLNPQAAVLFNQTNVSGTAGQAGYLVTNNSLASLAFDAEL